MTIELEKHVEATGLALWEQISRESPGLFNPKFWMGKVMARVMDDPEFKTNLFRLVDVLPVLRTTESISRQSHRLSRSQYSLRLHDGIKAQ